MRFFAWAFHCLWLGSLGFSAQAKACGFGTKPFACCQSSTFAGGGETRILSGCAFSKGDAWARCAGTASASINLRWDTSQCLSGSSAPNPGVKGHACTVARRANRGFTYYSSDVNMSLSREALCARARSLIPAGSGPVTHSWYTTFYSNTTHRSIAECQNGTWTASGKGVQSIINAQRAAQVGGGWGCLFKAIKD